jgi:hypothetical protein
MKRFGMAASALMLLALGGCQVSGPVNTLPVAPPPPAAPTLAGNWIGTDGVAISTFGPNAFSTFAVDTGARLAEGTYRFSDGGIVELTLTSLVRGTTSRVNCLLSNNQQLNCTAASGSQFSLVRTTQNPPPAVLAAPSASAAQG